MTKKHNKKKISLKAARLRRLDDAPLSEVVGGGHGRPDPDDAVSGTCATSTRALTIHTNNHNQAVQAR